MWSAASLNGLSVSTRSLKATTYLSCLSFALDPLAIGRRVPANPRSREHRQTLNGVMAVGDDGRRWWPELTWLFTPWDEAVHLEEAPRDVFQHPADTNLLSTVSIGQRTPPEPAGSWWRSWPPQYRAPAKSPQNGATQCRLVSRRSSNSFLLETRREVGEPLQPDDGGGSASHRATRRRPNAVEDTGTPADS